MDDNDLTRVGARYLGPSGIIWTVRSVHVHGARVLITAPTPSGERGAIVDRVALARMVRLDELVELLQAEPESTAATGVPTRWPDRVA